MSRVITIVNRELVVTSTNGSETQVQKIQILNNYYTQIVSTNVSVLNNEHKNVITFAASEFSPSSTAAQIQAYLSVLINNTAEVASATWGYDNLGVLFYVKQMSDGSVVYESPIGTITAPTGQVASFRTTAFTSTLNVIETNAAGSVPSSLAWQLINTGGAALTLNGVSIASGTSENPLSMEGKTLPNQGVYVYAPAFTYDATSTSVTIIYQTYP